MEALNGYGQERDEAIVLINTAVADGGSGEQILSRIDVGAGELDDAEKAKAERYVSAIQKETRGAIVKELDPGIGGMWNGNDVHIATGILAVHESIERTIAQVEETRAHEDYHAEHDHTAPLMVMAETKGEIAAVIGGTEFTETALVEGLVVAKTGDEFVSAEYVEYKKTLLSAVDRAGLNLADVENAVNTEKNVTLIDDRAKKVTEPEAALAG